MNTAPLLRQRGAVLVVGLIMLVVISLMGAVAYNVATQQERIAGNARDKMLAFEMAESALRLCESDIRGSSFVPLGGINRPADGLYVANAAGTAQWWETVNWAADTAVRELTFPAGSDRYARRPACVGEDTGTVFLPGPCELEGGCPETEFQTYRITARGFGQRVDSVATVQSSIRRPL